MDHVAALRLAVELIHMPSRVRAVRAEPLPDGVDVLLQIAAGEAATTSEAVVSIDRPEQVIRQAAAFFIEQILLAPEADSYRVLGATAVANSSELRRNMALLLRWLHPDMEANSDRSVFAGRVTRAWEDLKTPERRAAYDSALATTLVDVGRGGRSSRSASKRGGTSSNGASAQALKVHHLAHGPRPTGFLVRALQYLFRSPR